MIKCVHYTYLWKGIEVSMEVQGILGGGFSSLPWAKLAQEFSLKWTFSSSDIFGWISGDLDIKKWKIIPRHRHDTPEIAKS